MRGASTRTSSANTETPKSLPDQSRRLAGCRSPTFKLRAGRTLDTATRERIVTETRHAAYEIIDCKGATYYAVAAGVVRIIRAILRDESGVLTVSSLLAGSYGLAGV